MNKEQLLAFLIKAKERIKQAIESDHDTKTKALNIEYWLGVRYGLLEILRLIDFDEYIKQCKTDKLIDKALKQVNEIYGA